MFASDASNIFVDKVNGLIKQIVAELQNMIYTSLNNSEQKQKYIAWKLFQCILTNCNLDKSSRSMTSFAYNLWLVNREGLHQKEIHKFLKDIRIDNKSGNLYKLLRKINEMK